MIEIKKEENIKRIEKFRKKILDITPEICPERARIITDVYEKTESEPIIIRRAKSLDRILSEMSIYILEEELIVGNQASKPRSAPVFPEYAWDWIYEELDRFEKRTHDRFMIREETKRELKEILPKWKGKTLWDRIVAVQPLQVMQATEIGVLNWKGNGISGEGHIVVDYEMVLKNGFRGIIEKANFLLSFLDLTEPDNLKKRFFYEAVMIAYNGVSKFINRYADLAEALSSEEINDERRKELKEISNICRWISLNPPRTFYEALQLTFFILLIQQIESNGHSVSLGRIDQYLYPFYKHDIEIGSITPEKAVELISHFFIKLNTINKVRPEDHSRTQSGNPMYQNLVIGGQTPEGTDATNELSYLFLDALALVRLPEPNFYVRVHDNTPQEFLMKALEVVRLGFGMPAFVNDKVVVPSLISRGVSLEDALNYSTMGCLEVQVPGKWGYRANGKTKLNLLKILELALNNGIDPKTGIQLHPGKGDLTTFKNFEEVLAAWEDQLEYYTKLHVIADNINDLVLEELAPNPFCSALVQECLERGKHLNEGGAVYDMTSGALVGVPNVGNSLMTIKKLIFDEKVISGIELKKALDNNFEGPEGERILELILNKVPKYGEDEDEVDLLTRRAYEPYCMKIISFKNMRYGRGPIGGNYLPSTVTISANVPAGEFVGATPDGRKAFTPVADGVSPMQGTGKKGPTAIMKSVAKLPTILMTEGQLLNLRINPNNIKTHQGLERLAALIRGFFDLYGWHVQFNTVSTEMLRDAQKHPERYRDLVVRVAGYSAFFVDLDPILQEEIISRLEHGL
jgi:formate C-acetyltransferase